MRYPAWQQQGVNVIDTASGRSIYSLIFLKSKAGFTTREK